MNKECAKNYPEKAAIIFEGKEYTYKQVDEQSNLVANWAHEILQLRCNEVVALMMENRPEFIWTWLGLAKLGVITGSSSLCLLLISLAFINYKLHGASLTHVLKISEAKAFIVGTFLLSLR